MLSMVFDARARPLYPQGADDLVIALSATAALLPAHVQPQPIGSIRTSVQVTLPNGFLNLHSNDLAVSSTVGLVCWRRWWDGTE